MPSLECKTCRVGGALTRFWSQPARRETWSALADRLQPQPVRRPWPSVWAADIMDANNTGNAVKKREDTWPKMAEVKAFAHFRYHLFCRRLISWLHLVEASLQMRKYRHYGPYRCFSVRLRLPSVFCTTPASTTKIGEVHARWRRQHGLDGSGAGAWYTITSRSNHLLPVSFLRLRS